MKAIRLRTEYMENPIGIDRKHPRIYWNCACETEEEKHQSAYRIVAQNEEGETVWDTGKVSSSSMTHVSFEGRTLKSRERISYRIQLWNEADREGAWSETASFEMGLLSKTDWKAKWITGDYKPGKKRRYPVDCFMQKFSVDLGNVAHARAYMTACGVYEGRLNGARMGEFILAPGITDYRMRVQYQTVDITPLLRDGENTAEFLLADGWYRGSVGAWGMKNYYGSETKLLVQLEITMKDGSIKRICSDDSFFWSNDGPIRFADNKDGEKYDARKLPSYTGHAKETAHNVLPSASNNVPVTEHERFTPKLIRTPAGKTVLDFGQNIAGYIEFHITAREGKKLYLRFGEKLDSDGEFTQQNIQCVKKTYVTPLQEIRYICKEGENDYKTRFAIFGFQYVLVESNTKIKPEDFTAIAVYSDLEVLTEFDSSNALLNQFVRNTLWSEKNNSADLPTDCPTRERHGWSGDAQIFFNTACYLTNYAPFARKYEKDLTDWQSRDKEGRFPQIAPEGGTDPYMRVMNGSVGWADAGVMIPYRYYRFYNDTTILEENYDAMRRYARFMMGRCGKSTPLSAAVHLPKEEKTFLVNTGQAYGEWAEPEDIHKGGIKDFMTTQPEVSTAYTCVVMRMMKEIAHLLGKEQDEAEYRYYEEGCRQAYQKLIELPDYSLDSDRQALQVRPLYFDLLNEKQKAFAQKRLIQALDTYGWRVGTGFLSTPLILPVLADIDISYAYRLLENEEIPGWLSMPKNGATTVWEDWAGPSSDNGTGGGISSLDHYSKGACLEWVFSGMCGIAPAGENHFRIAPKPGGQFSYADMRFQSLYGTVSCRWETAGGKAAGDSSAEEIRYMVMVPANTTVEFVYPDGRAVELEAGNHEL